MKKCRKCVICPYVLESNCVSCSQNNVKLPVTNPVDCTSSNVIYLIQCTKPSCKQQYIGQTGRLLKGRIKEYIGYIKNSKLSEPTGFHFNQSGHNVSMLNVIILEKCKYNSKIYRESREEHFINLFETKYKGMNRKL